MKGDLKSQCITLVEAEANTITTVTVACIDCTSTVKPANQDT